MNSDLTDLVITAADLVGLDPVPPAPAKPRSIKKPPEPRMSDEEYARRLAAGIARDKRAAERVKLPKPGEVAAELLGKVARALVAGRVPAPEPSVESEISEIEAERTKRIADIDRRAAAEVAKVEVWAAGAAYRARQRAAVELAGEPPL